MTSKEKNKTHKQNPSFLHLFENVTETLLHLTMKIPLTDFRNTGSVILNIGNGRI